MPLALSHPSILLEACVQKRIEEFLTTHGFNYFHYRRCTLDGFVGCLGTYSFILRHLLSEVEKIQLETFSSAEVNGLSSYSFLWADVSSYEVVKKAWELGFSNGITFVYRYKDYYEVFTLAMPTNQICCARSFYLSKQLVIENFLLSFKYQNRDILEVVHNHSVYLKDENFCQNHKDLCLQEQKIKVSTVSVEGAWLSQREAECLRLIRLGLSNREISVLLNLSPRSIETFILRLKAKTGLSLRSEMSQVYEPFFSQ